MRFDNWSESFQVTDRGRTSELETETHIKVEYEGMSFNSCPLIQLYADDKWAFSQAMEMATVLMSNRTMQASALILHLVNFTLWEL